MPSPSLFSADFKPEPYWWEDAPPPADGETALPARADVAIIGSGYTGLHAALQTARAGRDTVVLEAEAAGHGCSSRNGGQVSIGYRPTHAELRRTFGRELADRIHGESFEAFDYLGDFIEHEEIDCAWRRVGRFHGAHLPSSYEALAREIENEPEEHPIEAYMVPRAEQRNEIGSDVYHGGVVYPQHASLHPGLYHLGLLAKVEATGARVVTRCRVEAVERDGDGFLLRTARGPLRTRDVVVATNGYTGPLSPWHRRRVIPIGSYVIATEPIGANLMQVLCPKDRVVSDSRKVVFYYRASPDRKRILFGGRVALRETDPTVSAPRLHAVMRRVFPELAETRVSHSWVGFVAYTFDSMPHIGEQDGVHYAMGYCGSGLSLASYCGMRVGQKVLGGKEGNTALDDLPFKTRPLYRGDPWFLGPAILYYKIRDRLGF